jgi:hypothetical protein
MATLGFCDLISNLSHAFFWTGRPSACPVEIGAFPWDRLAKPRDHAARFPQLGFPAFGYAHGFGFGVHIISAWERHLDWSAFFTKDAKSTYRHTSKEVPGLR